MDTLILQYSRYKPLFFIAFLISLLFWGGILVWLDQLLPAWLASWTSLDDHIRNTLLPPLVVAIFFLIIIVHTLYRIRHLGNLTGFAVRLTEKQQPDLYKRLQKVCDRLGFDPAPVTYICGHDQLLKSVRIFGEDHLALDGDLIAALTDRQGAIEFHMGQQLARLKDPYRLWRLFIAPALVLPLLGTAYRRARIYHYDRAGLSACKTKVDAAFGLAVEVTRSDRWKSVNIPEFASQSQDAALFWMSVNEMVSAEPWPAKRMAHLRALATSSDTFIPRRHLLAWLLAIPLPYISFTSLAGLVHVAWIALWLLLTWHWGQQLAPQITSLIQGKIVASSSGAADTSETGKKEGAKSKPAETSNKVGNPYTQIDADLETLGALAHGKVSKRNPIPCEGGDLNNIKLNYAPARYAYSCDQPVVYTRISSGEFEPGKRAYIRRYDWDLKVILQESENEKSGSSGK